VETAPVAFFQATSDIRFRRRRCQHRGGLRGRAGAADVRNHALSDLYSSLYTSGLPLDTQPCPPHLASPLLRSSSLELTVTESYIRPWAARDSGKRITGGGSGKAALWRTPH